MKGYKRKRNDRLALESRRFLTLSDRKKIVFTAATSIAIFAGSFLVANIAGHENMSSIDSEALTSLISSEYFINVTSGVNLVLEAETSVNGTVATAVDTVSVTTNSPVYRFYLSTSSTDIDSTKLYLNGDRTSPYYLLPTTSTSLDVNSWGYSTDTEGDKQFHAVPPKNSEVLIDEHTTGFTTAVPGTIDYDITYGIRANNAMPAGHYYGIVHYSVTAENSSRINTAVVYPEEVNIGESGYGENNITLTTSLMTNMDYGDWTVMIGDSPCLEATTETGEDGNLVITCNAPEQVAIGSYVVRAVSEKYGTYTSINRLSFVKPTDLFGITFLQDMTPQVCNATTTPRAASAYGATDYAINEDTTGEHRGDSNYVPTKTLIDIRDGKQYVVRKLADGKCWMVQNLDLDLYVQNVAKTDITGHTGAIGTYNQFGDFIPLNSTNTDINTAAAAWTVSGSNIAYNTQTSEGTTWNIRGGTGDSGSAYEVRSYDRGNICMYYNGDMTTPEVFLDCTTDLGEANVDSVGNYYNWPAATAGTGYPTYSSMGEVSSSICPKGWSMPLGGIPNRTSISGAASEVHTLMQKYGIANGSSSGSGSITMTQELMSNVMSNPIDFVRSQYYSPTTGAIDVTNAGGSFWTLTTTVCNATSWSLSCSIAGGSINAASAYRLDFTSAKIETGTYAKQGNGFAVRCVASD